MFDLEKYESMIYTIDNDIENENYSSALERWYQLIEELEKQAKNFSEAL